MNEARALPAHPGHDAADRGEHRERAAADSLPPLASSALLRGRSVVPIEHNGALYQLRSTRLGKLILTK